MIDEVENLERITFDANKIGLDLTDEFTMVLGITDGQTVDIVIRGLDYIPLSVTRAGGLPPAWTFDTESHELTITEFNGDTFPLWTIQP